MRIVWLDSCYKATGWVYEDEDLKANPKEIESVGYVCDITDKGVMITSTRSGTGGVVSPLVIPLGSIIDYNLLEV